MVRIAHLSDVHFGAHDPAVVAGAEAWLAEHRPDLVVISGDFTQRARVEQYREAGAFLDRLEAAGLQTLGVPGNHDIPLRSEEHTSELQSQSNLVCRLLLEKKKKNKQKKHI